MKMNYKEGCNILYNESFKRFANIVETDISQLNLNIIIQNKDITILNLK